MATSGISFSGFNDIDFNVVLNAIMQQESQPLTALQNRQTELQRTDSNYALLATKLSALKTAAADLSSTSSLLRYSATSSNTAAVTVSASSGAVAGRYEVVVTELARGQVTAATSTTADTDTTIVATGGTLTLGDEVITVSGPVTLSGLVSLVNANADSPATASIVETEPGQFRLVLTGKETGEANAFTIQNGLTGTTLAFAGNAVDATDATALINNIQVTSSSNTLESGIPGVSVTLLKKNPADAVVVTVGLDNAAVESRVDAFVTAYNDLVKFATDQGAAASKGAVGTLGHDALLRALRSELRNTLVAAHGTGAFTHLSEVGLGFNRTGQLTFDRAAFADALKANPAAVETLFADAGTGAFKAIASQVDEYTRAGGFVGGARTKLSQELSRLGRRMDDISARLATRRLALQAQFIAADQAIARLKAQQSALASFGGNISAVF